MAFSALRAPGDRRAEALGVLGMVVLLAAAAFALSPSSAPLAIVIAGPLLFIGPPRLETAALRAVLEGRPREALVLARAASALRPFGPIGRLGRDVAVLVRARADGASKELYKLLEDSRYGERSLLLRMLAMHVAGDASALREVLAIPARRRRALFAGLGFAWIRAVARTGTPGDVLLALDEVEVADPSLEEPARRALIAFEVCAAIGDRDGVEQLAKLLGGRLPRGETQRASAEAAMADGERSAAREILAAPRRALDPEVVRALSALEARLATLEPRVSREQRERARQACAEAVSSAALSPLDVRAWTSVTAAVAALMIGWHGVVARTGDGSDLGHLHEMGGLLVPIRDVLGALHLLTVPFVHAGAVHLTLNVLALLVFGPWVERLMGRVRMLLVFVLASVVSGLAVAATSRPTLLVGASGAIFGLAGAMAVVLVLRPELRRTRRAQEVLRGLGSMLVLQFVVDRLVPMVSGTAHVAGLLSGALAGVVLLPRRPPRAALTPSPR